MTEATPGRIFGTAGALVRAGAILLALVAVVVLLVELRELVIVFLIGLVLAEGLRPLVEAIEGRGVPRQLARAAVYVVLILAVAGLAVLLARPLVVQAREILADLPRYQAELERNLAPFLAQLPEGTNLSSQAGSTLATATREAFRLAAGFVRGIADVIVALLLSFLWLSASRPFGRFLLELLPPSRRPQAAAVWEEIARGFAGYVRGVGVNMVVIGLLTGIAAALLGLPAPVLLGVLAGLTEVLPVVGPIIGATPAVVLAFTISPLYPLLVALVYLVIQQIEAHTLVPLVMRRSVGLPALVVVLALAAGASVGGVGGAVVAVPVAFAVQVLIVRVLAPELRSRNEKSGEHDA